MSKNRKTKKTKSSGNIQTKIPNRELIKMLNAGSKELKENLPTGVKWDENFVFDLESRIEQTIKKQYQKGIDTIDIIWFYGTRYGTAIIEKYNGEWFAYGKNLLDIEVVFFRDGIRFTAVPFLTVDRILREEPNKSLVSVYMAIEKLDANILEKFNAGESLNEEAEGRCSTN